ncbi:MAG: type II/IV secretion system ATPase subunit [Candidatus Woesearchaeota archaeon]|nr:type II/IV secretion system ATPase subunit [Candidatus Woesearchaeota archaeon]
MAKKKSSRKTTKKSPRKKASSKKPKKPTKPQKAAKKPAQAEVVDSYTYNSKNIPIAITIKKEPSSFVPTYDVSIASLSKTTEFILEKIRMELIKQVNLGIIDITDTKKAEVVEKRFKDTISTLVDKYFPDQEDEERGFLKSYLVAKALGLGTIELLMDDTLLEEIVVNKAQTEPVWVYHKNHGWLRTTIVLRDEEQTQHYASIIGRRVGRQITVLEPLLDASLDKGDRVNATISPISTMGNTLTIRKFSRDPWTITRVLKSGTLTAEAAAWVWMAIHYEMSCIIAGGTASGKTSAMNCFANFFPPNQRVISIEDTREIQLPSFLHWVPMNTRLPNAEGKGQVSMEDLLVNSLRMRPDRIIVGEVRRKTEAETLFEAIHTGHSVYATFHANNAEEAIERLTNPPISVPKIMLPAISLIIVQFRNRRTGARRTFQIAEITKHSEQNVLLQYEPKKDKLVKQNKSTYFVQTLKLYTGYSDAEIKKELKEKQKVLEYLVKQDIIDVDSVGMVIAEYYTNKKNLMKYVNANKPFISSVKHDAA